MWHSRLSSGSVFVQEMEFCMGLSGKGKRLKTLAETFAFRAVAVGISRYRHMQGNNA